MGRQISTGAIAVLAAMIVVLEIAAPQSGSVPKFQRSGNLSGRLSVYTDWVDSGALLDSLRDKYLSLRGSGRADHRPGWSLTNGLGETIPTGDSRLEQPI